jgi:hypothetical protein
VTSSVTPAACQLLQRRSDAFFVVPSALGKVDRAQHETDEVPSCSLKFLFLNPLTLFLICSNCAPDGFGMEGSELLTYQICQNHVQRLRVGGEVPSTPGSRGLDPQALTTCAHWRPSNPRQTLSVRLCKSEPWVSACVKSTGYAAYLQISAQIAAFQSQALSRTHYLSSSTACWLEARTETFPPFFTRFYFHGPP